MYTGVIIAVAIVCVLQIVLLLYGMQNVLNLIEDLSEDVSMIENELIETALKVMELESRLEEENTDA